MMLGVMIYRSYYLAVAVALSTHIIVITREFLFNHFPSQNVSGHEVPSLNVSPNIQDGGISLLLCLTLNDITLNTPDNFWPIVFIFKTV